MTALTVMYSIQYQENGEILLKHRHFMKKNTVFQKNESWSITDRMLRHIPVYLRSQGVNLLVSEWVYPIEEETEAEIE